MTHGTLNGYNKGCRCEQCVARMTAYRRGKYVPKPGPRIGTCRGCGKSFQWVNSAERYCGADCRAEAKRIQAARASEAGRLAAFAKFGLTPGQYAKMLEAQDGLCAICRQPPGTHRLAVDHDHSTGQIRGLLCAPCNVALGGFHDDPARLRSAIAYLERSRDLPDPPF